MKPINLNVMRKTGRILMMSFSLILAAGFAAGGMLEANADQVNNFLNTKTYKTTGGGEYNSFTPDEEYLNSDGSANTDALVSAHKQMGIRLAEEGSVLLKNRNNALPLSTSDKITLMGFRSTSAHAIYGMDIGSPVTAAQNVSFQTALTDTGFGVNATVCDAYNAVSDGDKYAKSNKLSGLGYYVEDVLGKQFAIAEPSIDEIKQSAGESEFNSSISQYGDVGIVVIGRPSSEQAEYYAGTAGVNADDFSQSKSKNVLSLSDGERELINYSKTNFEKTVIIVTTSNAMELGELEADEGVDAVLWAGYPGNYGFIGVSNILAGKANPSGRLVDTYASDSASSPAMKNWGLYLYSDEATYGLNANMYYGGAYVVQAEGIYTGYKYYETRYEDTVLGNGNASSSTGAGAYATGAKWNYSDEVTYPFGYGLSYTTFKQEITGAEISADGKTATVTVTVENTGSVDGMSVVQVYGQSPYTEYDKTNSIEKASVQLLGYEKIAVAKGESEEVTVDVDLQYLASYDAYEAKSYVMEQSSEYYFALGCNPNDKTEGAHAAINNILAAKGYTTDDGMDAQGYKKAAYKFSWDKETDTFATSKAGVAVTNQLDDADYNYYKQNTVTYLSRSDWSGTWPKSYSGLSTTNEMLSYLKNSFYTPAATESIDVTFGAEADGDAVNYTDMFGSDFDDEKWSELLSRITVEEAVKFTASGNRSFYQIDSIHFVAGSSYVENGSVGIQKTLSGMSDENAPWYVSADDANAKYYCNTFGSPSLMASCWNKELMYEMGVLWGNDALFINIPMVWAPSINIHRTPYNGRNGEYYSEDGVLSGYTSYEVGTGALSKGLIAAVKHFAFNDSETSRLGLSTYMNEQTARENELRGFQIALEGCYDSEGNRSSLIGIMTAYNRIGACYAGAHTGLMKNILRGEWDYNGYATSDLLPPGNVSTYMPYYESILAGTTNYDTSLTDNGTTTVWRVAVAEIVDNVSGDGTFLKALQDDVHYSLWAFSQTNLANWMTDTTGVVWVWNWWRVTYYAVEIVAGIVIACGFLMYVYAECGPYLVARLKKKKADDGEKEEKE